MMRAYAILDGGGVKGAALAGCLKAAEELGIEFAGYGIGYGRGNPSVWLTPAESPPRSGHVAFRVGDRETVRRFHAAGLDAGGADEGPPGPRPEYGKRYYAAYLRDPDGTKVEAVVARPCGDP